MNDFCMKPISIYFCVINRKGQKVGSLLLKLLLNGRIWVLEQDQMRIIVQKLQTGLTQMAVFINYYFFLMTLLPRKYNAHNYLETDPLACILFLMNNRTSWQLQKGIMVLNVQERCSHV